MSKKTPEPWSEERFERWYREHPVIPSRDYAKTLVPRIKALGQREGFKLEKYGEATYTTISEGEDGSADRISRVTHDLYRLLIGDFSQEKPVYIVAGGTHGYEKGGPLAALKFAEEEASHYTDRFNIVIYPCLSPGPYEKELRFTEGRIDVNRDAFLDKAQSQEMQALARSIKELHRRLFNGDPEKKFTAAIDLHETPFMDIAIDKENAEVGGETFELEIFPQGMFLIAFDEDLELARKIIHNVRREGHHVVDDDTLYGSPNHDGVLLMSEMGPVKGRVRQLFKHFTNASFTTEYCDEHLTDESPDAERV
ncbi:MAG: hypothetical protein KJO85_10515, partial [Gammaproteobacteria bacterium]|nr:hypothetical protein [Gammaproteobacteria bacterium]